MQNILKVAFISYDLDFSNPFSYYLSTYLSFCPSEEKWFERLLTNHFTDRLKDHFKSIVTERQKLNYFDDINDLSAQSQLPINLWQIQK